MVYEIITQEDLEPRAGAGRESVGARGAGCTGSPGISVAGIARVRIPACLSRRIVRRPFLAALWFRVLTISPGMARALRKRLRLRAAGIWCGRTTCIRRRRATIWWRTTSGIAAIVGGLGESC